MHPPDKTTVQGHYRRPQGNKNDNSNNNSVLQGIACSILKQCAGGLGERILEHFSMLGNSPGRQTCSISANWSMPNFHYFGTRIQGLGGNYWGIGAQKCSLGILSILFCTIHNFSNIALPRFIDFCDVDVPLCVLCLSCSGLP